MPDLALTPTPPGDGRKLISDFPGQLRRTLSMLELSRLARRVDGEAIGPGNTLISLAKLTERYLSRTLRKEAGVRRGNWSSALSTEQLDCGLGLGPFPDAITQRQFP